MRITGGRFRGSTVLPPLRDATRPTTDMWRSTIFDALSRIRPIDGCSVVDLFAGTGSLGFESLSRGAQHATFVEMNRQQASRIGNNARQLSLEDSCTIVSDDVLRWLTHVSQSYDLIFADPPYDLRLGNKILTAIERHDILHPHGVVVIEHDPREHLLVEGSWIIVWHKEKGDTAVDIVQRDPARL